MAKVENQNNSIELENENLILKAKKATIKTIIVDSLSFILLCIYMYFRGISLIINLNFIGKILLTCGYIYVIAEIIDRYLISAFILTNKKIIIKRIHKFTEISLNEIKDLESSSVYMDLGYLTVVNEKGKKFKSGIIVDPDSLKIEINKYVQSLLNKKI